LLLLQPAIIVYKNAGDSDDVAGEREMESEMRESPARCGRLGRSAPDTSISLWTSTARSEPVVFTSHLMV